MGRISIKAKYGCRPALTMAAGMKVENGERSGC